MGHANLTNISEWVARRMYAWGKMSICDMVNGLRRSKQTVHASEGEYEEYYMLAMAVVDVVCFLHLHHDSPTLARKHRTHNPVIEPVDMTPKQQEVFNTWLNDDDCIFTDGLEVEVEEDQPYPDVGGRIGVFESIKWRYAKGWRNKYPEIPLLGNVTH
jgi:hypothetical protein